MIYKVEQKNGTSSSWTEVYSGTATTATVHVPMSAETVQFRVRAYEPESGLYSDYCTSEVYSVSFPSELTACCFQLSEGVPSDSPITVAAVSVKGDIPEDATVKVEVTNNYGAADEVWEDASIAAERGLNHMFDHQTSGAGCFNVRVKAEAGASGKGGSIRSVHGGFE